MTNPNLVNTVSVYMKTAVADLDFFAIALVTNPANSNNIIRIDTFIVCNPTASPISVWAFAPSGSSRIASSVEVPAYSTLVIVDKDYPVYLNEGDTLSAEGFGLQAICAYTTISDTIPPPPEITTSNMLLYLDAANTSSYPGTGTTWFDLSGNDFHGTLTNGPVWNSTYFDFDGDNDYVDMGTIGTSHPLQLSSPSGGGITIMLALWYDTGGDIYQRVADKSTAGSSADGWSLYQDAGAANQGEFSFEFSGGTNLLSGVTPAPGAWSIWSFTWNSSTGAWEWKQNNSSTATGTQTYAIPNVQTNMRLGTWNHTDARELNGRIGFFMVYDKVLNSSEITNNFEVLRSNYGL
jgi:hypothetical protein